jgi:hypothetical protein
MSVSASGGVGQAFGEPRRKCQLDTRIQRHHYARAAAIVARRDGMASGAQFSHALFGLIELLFSNCHE